MLFQLLIAGYLGHLQDHFHLLEYIFGGFELFGDDTLRLFFCLRNGFCLLALQKKCVLSTLILTLDIFDEVFLFREILLKLE